MPRATTTVTTTQEVTIAPKVQRKILTELQGYAALHSEVKALEGEKKGHSAAVLQLAIENVEGDKFAVEGFKIAVKRNQKKRSFNTDKLVKRLSKDGKYSVKAALALIEDCTDENDVKDHVRITVPGEKSYDE